MVNLQDWHREDIKAAVRKSGATLRSLSLAAGYDKTAACVALSQPWPALEGVIARHLGVHPMTIWPSRYDTTGNPKAGVFAAYRKSIRSRRAAATESAASQWA
jgi:Ner family transcriptional regulator